MAPRRSLPELMGGQARTKLIRLFLQAAILLDCAGCRSPGDWWRARGLDLWDCVPTAVIRDKELGFSISARVTPFVQTGLGAYGLNDKDGNSSGMALGRWGPRWKESAIHVLIVSMERQEMLVGGRWSRGPGRRYRYNNERPLVRQSGNLLVIIPFAGAEHASEVLPWARFPDWYSLPDSDVALSLGWFGLRIGIAPAQFVDFFCGLVNLDPLRDDAPPSDPERNADPSGDEPMPSLPSPAPEGMPEG